MVSDGDAFLLEVRRLALLLLGLRGGVNLIVITANRLVFVAFGPRLFSARELLVVDAVLQSLRSNLEFVHEVSNHGPVELATLEGSLVLNVNLLTVVALEVRDQCEGQGTID